MAYRRLHTTNGAKAWETLGREPEPWMRMEGGRSGSQGRGVAASELRATFRTGEAGRNTATLFEALLREQGNPGQRRDGNCDDLSIRER